jgi:predicted aconitase with swiveling domain
LLEDDERVPNDETKKTVHGYMAILPSVRGALLAQYANTEAEKMGKANKAQANAERRVHLICAARLPARSFCNSARS